MGRPALALGTWGRFRVYQDEHGWRARTLYRDFDGKVRGVERRASTKSGAEQALARALRDRSHADASSVLTPDTKVSVAAEKWYAELTDLAPSTMQAYRARLDGQVLPALGDVKLRELSVGLVDRHLRAVLTQNGAATARMTRSVLSGVSGLAARHDAMPSNPTRDVARISTKPKRQQPALSVEEVKRIRAWLAEDKKAKRQDLPDLVAMLSATGARIGEALAFAWDDVDLEEATVAVNGTVIRLKEQGLIVSRPKSDASQRVLGLPSWCVAMLRRRHQGDGLVFPSSTGGLRDPSNTRRMLRVAYKEMGVENLATHGYRRTVATLMDEAGLTAREAADQLGHARPSITQDVYFARKKRPTGAAEVLEQIG